MKFSNVIQFNSVPEWADSYLQQVSRCLYSYIRARFPYQPPHSHPLSHPSLSSSSTGLFSFEDQYKPLLLQSPPTIYFGCSYLPIASGQSYSPNSTADFLTPNTSPPLLLAYCTQTQTNNCANSFYLCNLHSCSYSNLKKLLYNIERDIIARRSPAHNDEETPLIGSSTESRADATFIAALNPELDSVVAFYAKKEGELFSQVELLEKEASKYLNNGKPFNSGSSGVFGSASPCTSPTTLDDDRAIAGAAAAAGGGHSERTTTPSNHHRQQHITITATSNNKNSHAIPNPRRATAASTLINSNASLAEPSPNAHHETVVPRNSNGESAATAGGSGSDYWTFKHTQKDSSNTNATSASGADGGGGGGAHRSYGSTHFDFGATTPRNITNANVPAYLDSNDESVSPSNHESTSPSPSPYLNQGRHGGHGHCYGNNNGDYNTRHHHHHHISTSHNRHGSPSHSHDIRNKARDLFILLHDLRSYARLNFTGFSKILKKFDKVTGLKLRDSYMENQVLPAYPFTSNTRKRLVKEVEKVTRIYAKATGQSDNIEAVFEELKKYLREQIVWDRNTVWRDMINLERRAGAVEVQDMKLASTDVGGLETSNIPFKPRRRISTRIKTFLYFLACTSVLGILLLVPTFSGGEQHRCWALLIYVSLLWATETFPLHVTAMMVPLLAVVLRVMRAPDPKAKNGYRSLTAEEATHEVFSAMFSPVIMLLLGGFTIAAALSKHNIARIVASWVLSKAGTRPRNVLLVNIFVATFASMWISNVAAPVLCFSLIQPILRTLPVGSSYAQCLIIGIALASNVGGMASPIASPQNIIAINTMDPKPSWLQWFFVTIPVCIITDLLIWILLVIVYRPNRSTPNINKIRYTPEKLKPIQIYVCLVTIATIILWCVESKLQWIFGDMGVIAIFPLVMLFCHPALLTKEDFNNFLWTVIMLAMGGVALGRAVQSSGLLQVIAGNIENIVDGMPLFMILCTVCGLILVVCTFISHTVGALIILPIVAEVGSHLPAPHSRLLVMGSALMASGAMGLPVSGFPNMNAVMQEDSMGNRYVTTKDFFIVGIPASIISYGIIISIGYGAMTILGF